MWRIKLSIFLILVAQFVDCGEIAPARAQSATAPMPGLGDPRHRPEKPKASIKQIRFLTGTDFPPFNYIDQDGRLSGYHVELARSICATLGALCSIEARPFDELSGRLRQGGGDVVLAGIAMTPANSGELAFSNPYFPLPARFVATRATKVDDRPFDPAGRRISVVKGTAHQAFLAAYFKNADVVAFDDAAAARKALRDGKVDAHFGDGLALSFWLAGQGSDQCCRFVGGPYLDNAFFGAGLMAAVKPDDGDLLGAIDYALAVLQDNGRLSELYLRYFPVGFF